MLLILFYVEVPVYNLTDVFSSAWRCFTDYMIICYEVVRSL